MGRRRIASSPVEANPSLKKASGQQQQRPPITNDNASIHYEIWLNTLFHDDTKRMQIKKTTRAKPKKNSNKQNKQKQQQTNKQIKKSGVLIQDERISNYSKLIGKILEIASLGPTDSLAQLARNTHATRLGNTNRLRAHLMYGTVSTATESILRLHYQCSMGRDRGACWARGVESEENTFQKRVSRPRLQLWISTI